METGLLMASRPRAMKSERQERRSRVSLDADDSAFYALTDFRREDPITVLATGHMHDALAIMHRSAVRALVVTDRAADDTDPQVLGLITSFDIERQRSRRGTAVTDSDPGGNIRVDEMMTAWDDLSLVHYDSLQSLTAKEIFDMFQGTGLTHLLVVETQADNSTVARGILSRAALAKRLGRRAQQES